MAERLDLACDPVAIRAMVERACGGQLIALGPEGRRASTLTLSGTPFETSVVGGNGKYAPTVRFVTEAGTQATEFPARVVAQLAAIRELVSWLPNGDDGMADLLQSFVATLFPDLAKVPARVRFATWVGVVLDAALPDHAARLKVYGNPLMMPGGMRRLYERWPGFDGLMSVPEHDEHFKYAGAAIEVDGCGAISYKLYLKSRHRDPAVPMKLVRYFGDPAWEALSELVRCGVDPARLYDHDFVACCSRGTGPPSFAISVATRGHYDLTKIVHELASRHHGTTFAVDALARAAESRGASWRYSWVGVGISGAHGVDKLNIYGTPTWPDRQAVLRPPAQGADGR
ncbi:hypothetical protein [Nocardia mexicana]|uniref:hypothetical protein n=1 Tax=Nocardia mexicana TaxID=279262 RepID=UPI0011C060C0|nr:hypothetical protein [Nocardia mexicana]